MRLQLALLVGFCFVQSFLPPTFKPAVQLILSVPGLAGQRDVTLNDQPLRIAIG